VFQQPTSRANRLTRDLQGLLIACEHDSRRVTRQELDGKSITVIANSFQGRRLNRSNDVVVKSDGCIYFTDPWTNPAAQEQWDASRGLVRRPYPEGRQAGGPTCPAADAVRAGSERLLVAALGFAGLPRPSYGRARRAYRRTSAQPDFWRSVMTLRRRRSPLRRSGVAR